MIAGNKGGTHTGVSLFPLFNGLTGVTAVIILDNCTGNQLVNLKPLLLLGFMLFTTDYYRLLWDLLPLKVLTYSRLVKLLKVFRIIYLNIMIAVS